MQRREFFLTRRRAARRGKLGYQFPAALVDILGQLRLADLGDVALLDTVPVKKVVAVGGQRGRKLAVALGELKRV